MQDPGLWALMYTMGSCPLCQLRAQGTLRGTPGTVLPPPVFVRGRWPQRQPYTGTEHTELSESSEAALSL